MVHVSCVVARGLSRFKELLLFHESSQLLELVDLLTGQNGVDFGEGSVTAVPDLIQRLDSPIPFLEELTIRLDSRRLLFPALVEKLVARIESDRIEAELRFRDLARRFDGPLQHFLVVDLLVAVPREWVWRQRHFVHRLQILDLQPMVPAGLEAKPCEHAAVDDVLMAPDPAAPADENVAVPISANGGEPGNLHRLGTIPDQQLRADAPQRGRKALHGEGGHCDFRPRLDDHCPFGKETVVVVDELEARFHARGRGCTQHRLCADRIQLAVRYVNVLPRQLQLGNGDGTFHGVVRGGPIRLLPVQLDGDIQEVISGRQVRQGNRNRCFRSGLDIV